MFLVHHIGPGGLAKLQSRFQSLSEPCGIHDHNLGTPFWRKGHKSIFQLDTFIIQLARLNENRLALLHCAIHLHLYDCSLAKGNTYTFYLPHSHGRYLSSSLILAMVLPALLTIMPYFNSWVVCDDLQLMAHPPREAVDPLHPS